MKKEKKNLSTEAKKKRNKIIKFGCLPILGLFILIVILTNIGGDDSSNINYPFKLVQTKKENTGPKNYHLENIMSLYTTPDNIDIDTLKQFCLSQKEGFSNNEFGVFMYLVFFDSKENAIFPNNSFSGFYGTDSIALKHIKAYYEFNRLNGYSKLNIYNENAWKSSAKVINLGK